VCIVMVMMQVVCVWAVMVEVVWGAEMVKVILVRERVWWILGVVKVEKERM